MSVSVEQLEDWMRGAEDEHLEFKEARNQYSTEKLIRDRSALANERGGNMVLGVTNRKPRRVVGTNAFADLNDIKAKLVERLRLRIEATILDHPDGRVLVFEVPSRPIGMPITLRRHVLDEGGEDLVTMTPDQLGGSSMRPDPTTRLRSVPGSCLLILDPRAVENMRKMWVQKSGNEALHNLDTEQLLNDVELVMDGEVTYAARVFLGDPPGPRQTSSARGGDLRVPFE